MANRISASSGSERSHNPGQGQAQPAHEKTGAVVTAAANWNSGITQADDNESESIVVNSCDQDESESANSFENSSTGDQSEQEWANRAASKMNTPHSKEPHVAANTPQLRQKPTKFCLSGMGTSCGFSAAVAGFVATAFLYDLITRFPEKATTEICVAFGAPAAIALGGTLTCSTSMVFMIRELCKTSPN